MKLANDDLNHMKAFEEMTSATVKDCLVTDEDITFVVKKGDMGLAIGKNGKCVKKAKKKFGKKVSLVEHSDDAKEFAKNIFNPAPIENIKKKDKTLEITINRRQKNRIMGRKGKRIKRAKKLLKRHHDITNVNIKW